MIERYTQTINASGRAELAGGNYFLLLTANATVNVRADARGVSEGFNGVIGGVLIRRVKPWDQLIIIGAAGTTLEYFHGHEFVEQDETDIRLGVSAVTGTVATAERPSDTVSNLAPVVIATAAAAQIVAASITRRRMRVQADSTNPGSVFIRTAAGTSNIFELQPGVSQAFDTFDELFARNDTGANCTVYRFEET